MTYGCEVLTLNADMRRLNAVEMDYPRRSFINSRREKIRNEKLRRRMNV